MGYSPWGHKESDMTERLHFHFHLEFTIQWRRRILKSKQRQHLPVYRECYEVDSCGGRGREPSLCRLVLAYAREITNGYLKIEKNPRTGKKSMCKGPGWERAC